MKLTNKILIWVISMVLVSCSTENGYSEFERTEVAFQEMLNGEVCPTQWWKTSATLNVTVKASKTVRLYLLSSENGGTLYDYKEIESSGEIKLTAPQGKGTEVYLLGYSSNRDLAKKITLTGKNEEFVTLDFSQVTPSNVKGQQIGESGTCMSLSSTNVRDDEPDPVDYSLYGSSVNGDGKLLQLTDEQVVDWAEMMDVLSRESANAKTQMGLNVNYELGSRGPFTITWIAGNCMSNTPHILGYYYHSPGTYDDIEYVDLCETEIYDVVDGIAKVQYQVNQMAVEMYPGDNLVMGKWYAANFDMKDKWNASTPYLAARKGDNAWNSMAVFQRYGRNVSALRGLTFEINVPAGKRLGFYDRAENIARPDQYDRLMKQNIRPYTDREHFKGTSYSAEGMNTINSKGNFRSFIHPLHNMMWMGMENDITGGDLDCNDVIFGVSAELDIYLPEIVDPDLYPGSEYGDKMPWTIAYEDVSREADFDFNDAVIKLVPDYERELCCVTVQAAGSTSRMYLHYDGPDGDVNMGEIHKLLGGSPDTKINTKTSVAQTPFVEIDCVPWPKDYTMDNDAKRFWIEIQRGTCEDCTDMITLAYTPGQIPQALLVAGEWKWPTEGTNIISAYKDFSNWAKDNSNTSYWNWYSSPKTGSVVSY